MKSPKRKRLKQGNESAQRSPAHRDKFNRSKVVAGLRLLPGMSSNHSGTWGRIMRDVLDRLVQHVGGDSMITETQRFTARRYTRTANRKRLAAQSIDMLNASETSIPAPEHPVREKGQKAK
jgi:hypothetical protein